MIRRFNVYRSAEQYDDAQQRLKSQFPKGVASDKMPAPPETPDALRPGRLWLLAGCSLLLASGLEILFTVAQVHSDSLGRAFGRSDGIYIQIAAAIFSLHALLAAIVPAVLAEGHRAFRSALIAGHIVIAWVIQTGGYSALLPFDAEMLAELASVNLLSTLGIVAGLWGGLALLATLWGWTLTRRPNVAQRPTFSVRGLLIATAAAAFLFASPRIIAPIVTSVVRSIHSNWVEDRRWVGTTSSIESDMNGMSLLVGPLVIGFLLAITLASAMWISRSRRGWFGVILGSLTVASFAVVGEILNGGPVGPVGIAIAVFVSFLAGSLLATLQTFLWWRFGWQLVCIHRRDRAAR